MRRVAALVVSVLSVGVAAAPPSFTVDQILTLPPPDNLIASPVGSTIAWTFNERGVRNIYVADAPGFQPRRLTPYVGRRRAGVDAALLFERRQDDRVRARRRPRLDRPGDSAAGPFGQPDSAEDSSVVRAGRRRTAEAPRRRRRAGDRARRHARGVREGSPDLDRADRRLEAGAAGFFARGTSESPVWSPDGRTLAFVSNRGDHSFIGLFTPDQPIRYLAPSTSRDSSPAWSPDGRKIAFLRQPGAGGTPRSPLVQTPSPWSILVADAAQPIRIAAP